MRAMAHFSSRSLIALLVALGASACGPSTGNTHGGGGSGGSSGAGGNGGSGGSGVDGGDPQGSNMLTLIIRDFRLYNASNATTNPDFENVPKTNESGTPDANYMGPWHDPEIVTDTIGSDHKPVYKHTSGTTLTTHGKAAFDQWYNDVAGTNIRVLYPLTLAQYPNGTSGYDSSISGVPYGPGSTALMFFPIDDKTMYATAFGDEGDAHNYSFTAEAHTMFTYTGGETFDYRGDDDVFVYIDGKLVINLGGIHDADPGSVKLDDLHLTVGQSYPLDFFFAERHKGGSNVLFTTTLKLVQVPIT